MHRRCRNWSAQGEPMMGSPGPESSRELALAIGAHPRPAFY